MGNMGCEIWGHVTAHEVGAHHLQRVDIDLRRAAALHLLGAQVAREGEARRTLDEPFDLGAAEVLGLAGELGQRDVGGHAVGGAHVARVDRQDLLAPRLVGQRDLDLHLEAAGAEQRLVDHVFAVRHPDDQDVVEGIDAVDLGEQLVDHRVVDAGAVLVRAALLADAVDLVEDDDVQVGVVAALGHLGLGVGEERAHVLLRLADVLRQHLGAVDDLRLCGEEQRGL